MNHGDHYPSRLSVAQLFDNLPVIVEDQRMGAEPPLVHPEEALQVKDAVHRRRVEFATGRSCARRALARMRIENFVLRRDPQSRAPTWPSGVVGSITHTGAIPGGYCGVAVASAGEVLTIGFDAEAGDLAPELWSKVLTAAESERLLTFPPSRRSQLARLAFSAKECFYKAQFPLTRRFVEFEDVEVSVDKSVCTFEVRVVRGPALDSRLDRCRGRYIDNPDMVLTGIALSAGDVAGASQSC